MTARDVKDTTVRLAIIALATAALTGLLNLGAQWIAIQGQRQAAVAAEEVKDTLAEKSVVTDDKLEQIHTLVNSDMGEQKLRTAQALRRIADLTGNLTDIDNAVAAEEDYRKHQSRQAVVDSGQGP